MFFSLLAHLVGIVGLCVSAGGRSDEPDSIATFEVQRVAFDPSMLRGYRETRVAAPAPPPPQSGQRVAYAQAPGVSIIKMTPPPIEEPAPAVVKVVKPKVRRKVVVLPQVAFTPPVPPAPPPAATPSPVATTPVVAPTPLAAAPPPSASPSPAAPNIPQVTQDPRADFAIVLGYHNDDRIKRDEHGYLVLDIGAISQMPSVRPVLSEFQKMAIPLSEAPRFGLRPLDRVVASVSVTLEAPRKGLPGLVQPARVLVNEVTLQGRPLDPRTQDRLYNFIHDQVSTTYWFPASNYGVIETATQQTFAVEILQVRDDSVAGRR